MSQVILFADRASGRDERFTAGAVDDQAVADDKVWGHASFRSFAAVAMGPPLRQPKQVFSNTGAILRLAVVPRRWLQFARPYIPCIAVVPISVNISDIWVHPSER